MRHVAKDKNGQKIIISYMLIPESTKYCLATYPENIRDDNLRRELVHALESIEGQRTTVLAEILGRRPFADTGKHLLQVLHETGNLVKVSIDDVTMLPAPNAEAPLRAILESMGKIGADTNKQAQGFNPHAHNLNATGDPQEMIGVARNLLIEADLMEADARRKRADAYKLAPSLAPMTAPSIDAEVPDSNIVEPATVADDSSDNKA